RSARSADFGGRRDRGRHRDLVRLLPFRLPAARSSAMTVQDGHDDAAIVRTERRWATISIIIIVVLALLAAFAGIHQATMPQARVETTDPARIHLSGEFVESNLGSALEPNGAVTVRAIGQQYSFTPSCLLLPAQTP